MGVTKDLMIRRTWKSIVRGLGSTDLEVRRTWVGVDGLEVHRMATGATTVASPGLA